MAWTAWLGLAAGIVGALMYIRAQMLAARIDLERLGIESQAARTHRRWRALHARPSWRQEVVQIETKSGHVVSYVIETETWRTRTEIETAALMCAARDGIEPVDVWVERDGERAA